jgi:hypothetical protein
MLQRVVAKRPGFAADEGGIFADGDISATVAT